MKDLGSDRLHGGVLLRSVGRVGERYSSDNANMSVEQRMHYVDLAYILCYKSTHIHTHGVQGMITGGPVGFLKELSYPECLLFFTPGTNE